MATAPSPYEHIGQPLATQGIGGNEAWTFGYCDNTTRLLDWVRDRRLSVNWTAWRVACVTIRLEANEDMTFFLLYDGWLL